MIIHTYIICHNEEELLPYILKHYGGFSDKITIWDNYSTDESINIINDFPNTEVIQFDSGGEMRDDIHKKIKNTWWIEKSRGIADWVITVDSDEFICSKEKNKTVRDVLSKCKRQGVTIPKTEGYDMLWTEEKSPSLEKPLFSQVVKAIPNWFMSKRAVFNPIINHPCVQLGCHPGDGRHDMLVPYHDPSPVTIEEGPLFNQKEAVCSEESVLYLKHFRYVNNAHFYKKDKDRKERRPEIAKAVGWSAHLGHPIERREKDYFGVLENLSKHIVEI